MIKKKKVIMKHQHAHKFKSIIDSLLLFSLKKRREVSQKGKLGLANPRSLYSVRGEVRACKKGFSSE